MENSSQLSEETLRNDSSENVLYNQNLTVSAASKARPFLLPVSEKVTWIIFFSLMIICAIIGNSLVIWVIAAHRRMKTVTNYFLLNLSIADLMMAILNVIFNFIYMIDSHWPFGAVCCTISNFVASMTVCTSVFSIMAISIDRYVVTLKVNGPKMTKIISIAIIIAIWFGSILIAIPNILYSQILTLEYKNGKRHLCLLKWPDFDHGRSKMEYFYNIAFFQFTYVLPVISMGFTYGLIGKELWGFQIDRTNQRNIDIIKSKRKVIRMFIVMVFSFALCWLPYHVFFIYKDHNVSIMKTSYIQHVYLAFYWLAMSNALINPIIYYWMNTRFREYFKIALSNVIYITFKKSNVRNTYLMRSPGIHRDSRI